MSDSALIVDFAGEVHRLVPGERFTVGRNGTLAIDDNPYLHRIVGELRHSKGFWWLDNVGSRIAVHIQDGARLTASVLAPGATLPLVFPRSIVSFSAGGTVYELWLDQVIPGVGGTPLAPESGGDTTISPTEFTESQRLAILALAEPLLRHGGAGASDVPSAVQAARRLGWTQTKFNRKLDNVCDKLDRAGVAGLRGGPGNQAASRRIRLVEYALGSLLVTQDDLDLLDREAARSQSEDREGAGT
ncbi:MAG TPA: hypothetical protein PLA46_08745 [Phycicoccus sp.]|nr:hypothetical protein [Phycicoccus sp.]